MAIPFPEPWMRDRKADRTLAILCGRRIVTEHGETFSARTWPAIADALFAHDLVLYVQHMSDPPLFDALDDEAATVTTRGDGSWVGVAVRRGRKVRHVYEAPAAWGRDAVPELLADVRTLHASFGIRAAPSTASGLGVAMMRREWSGETVGRPTYACWRVMRETLVGGRVDTVQPGRLFPALYELDINDAYASAAARPLPGGSAVRWNGKLLEPGPEWHAVTGYYYCTIVVHERLQLGPVVLRGAPGEPNVIPAAPGTYHGWLWAEDVAELRRLVSGVRRLVTVLLRHGWYWRRWARAARVTTRGVQSLPSPLTLWARRMHRARTAVPASVRPMVKLATVAGIGRFAADLATYRIVRQRLAPEDRQVTDPEYGLLDLWVHREDRDAATGLVHWASYIQAAVRRELWRKALPYAEAGGLVATNYDALYVTTRPGERSSRRAGGWKLERLQDAVIPAARHLRSRTKVRLPGIPVGARTVPLDMPAQST